MKLYYSPGACSLSAHIVACEAGIELQLQRVDLKAKLTESGADFLRINPKGAVPALELDKGGLLTEVPAIVQFLADRKPESGLAPANGTLERYRLQEMLGFINSEIHKNYSPLFSPTVSATTRLERIESLRKQYAFLESRLDLQQWLVGDRFTAADAYLFTVTNWAAHLGIDFSEFTAVAAFQQRIADRPGVQAAMRAEGLLD